MKKYIVTLTESERAELRKLISTGKGAARRLAHARVLLKADQGLTDERIAREVEVGTATIERVRRRFVEEGLEAALNRKKRPAPPPRVMDGQAEAHLITLACSPPPEGRARWTLHLLADRMVQLRYVEHVSHETVRQTLKKTSSSLGCGKSGACRANPARPLSARWKT